VQVCGGVWQVDCRYALRQKQHLQWCRLRQGGQMGGDGACAALQPAGGADRGAAAN
jgi:hypothetical protein